MKKKKAGIVLLIMAMAIVMHAQQPTSPANKIATISLISFQQLVINTSIEVQLIQDSYSKTAMIEGDEKSVSDITLFIAKGVMTVSGKQDSYKGKIKLTIPVNKLFSLEVNADADISSLNAITSSRLSVLVNGDCALRLKSTGKIVVGGAGEHDIRYVDQLKHAGGKLAYRERL